MSVTVKDSPVDLNASASHAKIEEKNKLIFISLNLLTYLIFEIILCQRIIKKVECLIGNIIPKFNILLRLLKFVNYLLSKQSLFDKYPTNNSFKSYQIQIEMSIFHKN